MFKKFNKAKKSAKSSKLSLYSNLVHNHKTKKDGAAKRRAKYLASLPKNPFKRFIYRLNPKHFAEYWFNKDGAIRALKILGIIILVIAVLIGSLFIYFRKDLDAIRPGELAKSVQTNVNTYLDRNGNVLWEDTGDGDYKLVVDDDELSQYLKDATVAIEDHDFYKHGGISISGLFRAVINNLTGGRTQGGSTLTQQLVKQVFFSDESSQRGLSGIPRKIKEMIIAIEVERMYSKSQILDLYLNESPYGGRRNGAESASQTYFGKAAKDLSIAEAALLAAIPQNPSYFNPYNEEGNDALIERQHKVLDKMVEYGYITEAQAKEAKAYPILDNITPETNLYSNIKAPHFVQMVKAQLEKDLGTATVGKGGLTITTTLDLDIQNKLEEAMDDMFSSSVPTWAGFTNGAATVEDTKTGQIVALVGSRDYNYEGFGQDNAATAYLQPGSTIKAFDYAELFENKGSNSTNYGSGSILADENIDSIYGTTLRNADQKFNGNITIRSALATSRNIPAVKAMYISGVKNTLDLIHNAGATSYCTVGDEVNVGLAAAIGGCGVKQIDLVNAYATLARQGIYKKQSTILSVKNSSNETLEKYSESTGKQVISAQSAYIVTDILHDDTARIPLDGYRAKGMYISGVDTATKTGTSDKDGNAKDIWMMSYSPVLTMGVWLGNSDASILKNGTSSIPGSIIAKVMEYAHKTVYANENKWKSGDWFTAPSGIQTVGKELYPSWWSKTQNQTKTTLTFDKVSKKKATDLTPSGARVDIEVTKSTDPVTKKDVYTVSDTSYDATADDDVHKSTDVKASAAVNVKNNNDGTYTITIIVTPGTYSLSSVDVTVGGSSVTATQSSSNVYTYTGNLTSSTGSKSISITMTDIVYYTSTASGTTPSYS